MTQGAAQSKAQVIGLFPTPIMLTPGLLKGPLFQEIVDRVEADARETNAKSGQLSHSKPVNAETDPLYRRAAALITPRMAEFGELLFGEKLDWNIKEIWVNLLESGGNQALHNHANSFISGVVYLTPQAPGQGTIFHKALGGSDYAFVNQNQRTKPGPFSASRWQVPQLGAGDMVLFPSYMLHEVPPNRGGRRMTMAFNALPDKFDSWGYEVRFR